LCTSSCRKLPALGTSNERFRSIDKPSFLCSYQGDGIRHQHGTIHKESTRKLQFLPFARKTGVNSGFSHCTDRFQWGTHLCFAPLEYRQIETSRLVLQPGFSFRCVSRRGQHRAPRILCRIAQDALPSAQRTEFSLEAWPSGSPRSWGTVQCAEAEVGVHARLLHRSRACAER
jgi:hypothetical protein